jgi:hypothetical protein
MMILDKFKSVTVGLSNPLYIIIRAFYLFLIGLGLIRIKNSFYFVLLFFFEIGVSNNPDIYYFLYVSLGI